MEIIEFIFEKPATFIIGCVFLLILGVGYSNWECGYRAKQMGVECKWNPISGCLIKSANGNWVEIDHYRVMDQLSLSTVFAQNILYYINKIYYN